MYNMVMENPTSHRKVIELWQEIAASRGEAWLIVFARDIQRHLGGVPVNYYMVRRWSERDNIPIQYHSAVVAAARERGFDGVSHAFLADIKAKEYLGKHAINEGAAA